MQAIKTIFYGPNNRRGSRIGASCEAAKLSCGYDHGLNLEDNHRTACEALMRKMNWSHSVMLGGQYKGDFYWVFNHPISPIANPQEKAP